MVEYKCNKCEKVFDRKSTYDYHINKKIPCDELKTQCKFCEKDFSRKSSMKRHMVTCKAKYEANIENQKINLDNSNCNVNVNSNKGTINNMPIENQIINITINPFLCDDMSKLTGKQKLGILKKCYMSIPELIRQINLNQNMPENHNVYISNIKSKYGHINDGQKWILTKVDQLLDDLVSKKKDDIEELLGEYEEELPEKVVDKIRDVIASLEYDPLSDEEETKDTKKKKKFKKQIVDEVKLLLYNNKEIPMDTRYKMEKKEKKNLK
jgi:hypothetical protein